MTFEDLVGLAFAIGAIAYLVVMLLLPERFQ